MNAKKIQIVVWNKEYNSECVFNEEAEILKKIKMKFWKWIVQQIKNSVDSLINWLNQVEGIISGPEEKVYKVNNSGN
jgi:hypothetical protein